MTDENENQVDETPAPEAQGAAEIEPAQPPVPLAAPIQSRFLFVDVAALRAKQLRRGARPRLRTAPDAAGARPDLPHKAERVAMEEVRQGFVAYDLPDLIEPAEPAEGES